MGVTGLWTIVHPCARPIKIETLNKKRLAVDASIWIYQFLKAVRDKEGNQLRNSHVVGFFRRVCKLLFIGIKPIFVFDGGAPILKRQTINSRKRRREGRREDAAKTAGKLLAIQMQRAAEEDARRRKELPEEETEEPSLPENVVYAEEVRLTQAERQKNRGFRKADAYHLPELDVSMAEMGQPNDPRIMSLEELQAYAGQFNTGENVNFYDFSKIDFNGMFFQSLPPADQYNILNAARLRSRLRMGYSKEQLDTMFPDRMAFSKFQIERVRERNELTQRLMQLQGMTIDHTLTMDATGRVAGEKGREYVLVKNDGVEGGWVLGVMTKDEGLTRQKAIDVDKLDKAEEEDKEISEDEDAFEDVPIEGLNRLPKLDPRPELMSELLSSNIRRRKDFWKSRNAFTKKPIATKKTSDSLFVGKDSDEEQEEDLEEGQQSDENEELQRAIALSLQTGETPDDVPMIEEEQEEEPIFLPQRKVQEPTPFAINRRAPITRLINAKSTHIANEKQYSSDEDDDIQDLQKALRQSKQQPTPAKAAEPLSSEKFPGFDGPLPFEQLDLGFSLFDKKKKPEESDSTAGGFLREGEETKKKAEVVPPWFSNETEPLIDKPKPQAPKPAMKAQPSFDFVFETASRDIRQPDVIDLEASQHINETPELIEIDSDEELNATNTEVAGDGNDNAPEVSRLSISPQKNAKKDVSDEEDDDWEEVETSKQSEELETQSLQPTHNESILSESSNQINSGTQNINEASAFLEDDELIVDPDVKADEDEHLYSDEEEDQLFRQIMQEEKEHERFASSLNNRNAEAQFLDFDEELKNLKKQQKKDRRDADEVTQTMITECQQLLALFGLPFITAPMEAEAQCAELVRLGLVDGVVTDDSDIFLFGGTRVYKNMFNQAKTVECYLTKDLEEEFGLKRERLIAIAQLLGSDYTEGLPGVGPVTALEIISEFETLANFKRWFSAVQSGTRTVAEDAYNEKSKFRRYATKLTLPTAFPDVRVEEAYLKPEVDSDPSQFVWGVPNLDGLRSFLSSTIGWSLEGTDEVLVPVIRHMNTREVEGVQSNITAFFSGSTGTGAYAPRQRVVGGGSKRLRNALEKIGQRTPRVPQSLAQSVDNAQEDENEASQQPATKKRAKRKAR
jgi:DNA excision repair protein ERCC-5